MSGLRLPRRLLTADETARMLRVSTRVFRRRLNELARAGFPPPVPGLPERWDRVAIEAWLDRQMPAPARLQDPAREVERVLLARAQRLQCESAT